MTARALVRDVPDTFDRAIRPASSARRPAISPPISIERARAQHAAYAAALEELGLAVERLASDPRFPDCCFVEDPVIVVDDLVISAPMAAPSRRGEAQAVVAYLAGERESVSLEPPATLDGGDVVRVDARLFVGRSSRTNDEAARQLSERLAPLALDVVQVEVRGVLHLKSACTYLGDGALLAAPGRFDRAPFAGLDLLEVPEAEARAANGVGVRGSALLAAGFPRTAELVAARGMDVRTVEAGEFALAGGSLSCLSVLFDG